MLSRGTSNASSRLKRAKSSASVKTRAAALEPTPINPEVARHHALTAASIAFDRAGERMRASSGSQEVLYDGPIDSSTMEREDKALRRRQSVRFTGPNAAPTRQSSITRRTAPSYKDHGPEAERQRLYLMRSESTLRHPGRQLTALPPAESISSTPSSYRKLRKSKSMFSPRKGPPLTFGNATPKSYEFGHRRYRRLSNDDRRQPPKMGDLRPFSSLSQPVLKNGRQPQDNYDQDAAIQIARNQYLEQLEKQRLKEKPSILSITKRRGSQKTFRRTVRTSSTNSYGNAVGSTQPAEPVKKPGLGQKARNLSVSLKQKFKRVFHRNQEDEHKLPNQHVEALRVHFGETLSATSGLDHEGPLPPAPDDELLSRVSSRASSRHRMPVHLDRKASPGSIRSVRSSCPTLDKSRVTSWTVSTAANSLTKQQILEKKRLSIIQENGGPHQPSSSVGRIGVAARKGYSVFRKPLRNAAGHGRANEPVDSQRIFSALQKRLDGHSRTYQQDEGSEEHSGGERSASRKKSRESLRKVSMRSQYGPHSTIRMLPSGPEDAPRRFSTSSIARKPVNRNASFLEGGLTYQQIAEQNESLGRAKKKELREVKSAFFPSTTYYEKYHLSPYRRAIQSSLEEEPSHGGIHPREDDPAPPQQKLSVPWEGSISPSVYSRSGAGSPKLREATSGMENGRDLGMATILETNQLYSVASLIPTPPAHRKVSTATSTGSWKGWMAAEIASLAMYNRQNPQPSANGRVTPANHRRERAQIDGDDVQISSKYKWGSIQPQPMAKVLANDVFRPVLKHKTSDQMIEKFPLRFPLLERKTSSETTTTIKRNTGAPGTSGAPPPKADCKPSCRYSSALKPGDLHQVVSFTSRESQNDQDHGLKVLTDSTNSNRSRQHSSLEKLHSQSSNNIRSRYSPERAERLRRMQSSNVMGSKENIKASGSMLKAYHHQQENQAINDLTPISTPGADLGIRGAGTLEPMGADGSPMGSERMVQLFLNKRRNGQVLERGSSPVFI